MSVQRVKNGKGELIWRAQWRENGKGRTRTLGKVREMSRAEAERQRDAIVGPLKRDGVSRPTGVTLAAFTHSEYLVSRSRIWKRSTELTTTHLIESCILPELGGRIIGTVTRRDLESLLDNLEARYSESVVKRVRFQLQAIFAMAAGDGRISTNPTLGLKNPRCSRKSKAPAVGDNDQIVAALLRMPLRERLFTSLCCLRGMRPGEVAALRVGDTDGEVIQVERRVYRGTIDTVKNGRPRTIPVEGLRPLLDGYVATLLDQSPGAWLFPSETGKTPINYPALFRKRIAPALKAAGVAGLNYQAMRKTFAVTFRLVEPDVRIRASVMGHSADVHENEYIQITDAQRAQSIRKLGDNLQ